MCIKLNYGLLIGFIYIEETLIKLLMSYLSKGFAFYSLKLYQS